MGQSNHTSSATMMIVEGSAAQAEELRTVLEKVGYQVLLARNDAEALVLLDDHHPAVVISDTVLPETNGLQLCRAIKGTSRLRHIPVILLISLANAQEALSGLECGADAILVKPLNLETLHSQLQRLTAAHGPREHATVEPPIDITLDGQTYQINASRQQLLNVLLPVCDVAARRDHELSQAQQALRELHESLEQQVEERTTALHAEIARLRLFEGTLREREHHLRSLLQNSLDIVTVIDSDGTIRYLSPAIERLLGYSPEELLGANIFTFIHPDDRAQLQQVFDSLTTTPEYTFSAEYRLQHKDGSWRYIESISANQLASPMVAGIVVNSRDVTERKQREEAERANWAKSEFLSRMSHELRTPLNAILGFSQLLELEHLADEHLESVRQITKAGHHLLSLIDEVLNIAHIETGRLSISIEPVLVADVLREAIDLVRPLAAPRRIQITAPSADTQQVYVMADRQRIKQVFLNLLSNAIKYNRDMGEVQVTCETPAEQCVRITFTDTGFGLSQQQLGRLFIPFERLGSERSGIEGTGLGLTLCKTLTEAMGGRIGVESQLGQGTRFWIELDRTDEPVERLRSERLALPAGSRQQRASRTILYIEDNLSNLRLVERILARRPEITLLVAMQASLGLDLARQHHPDLILLDLNLPDMPGVDVLRVLQNDPATVSIPVVVISADATAPSSEDLGSPAVKAYLTKPIDIMKFLRVLENVFGSNLC